MNKRKKRHINLKLDSLGISYSEIAIENANDIVFYWKKRFCSGDQDVVCAFDCMKKDLYSKNAIDKYTKIECTKYFINVEIGKNDYYLCECRGGLPEYYKLKEVFSGTDVYIFDEKIKWTFVITHEGEWINDPFYSKCIF